MATDYTQEQIEDITKREAEALEVLKRLQLTPACQILKHNIGDDVFTDKLYPYLQDTKYATEKPVKSPFTK